MGSSRHCRGTHCSHTRTPIALRATPHLIWNELAREDCEWKRRRAAKLSEVEEMKEDGVDVMEEREEKLARGCCDVGVVVLRVAAIDGTAPAHSICLVVTCFHTPAAERQAS